MSARSTHKRRRRTVMRAGRRSSASPATIFRSKGQRHGGYHGSDGEGSAREERRRHDGLQEGAERERAATWKPAIDWLRTKGLAAAAKKSEPHRGRGPGRRRRSGTKGAAVEVNSETDFVAKNEQFQDFVRDVTQIALGTGGDIEALKAQAMPAAAPSREADQQRRDDRREPVAAPLAHAAKSARASVVPYIHNARGRRPRQDRRARRARERGFGRGSRAARQAARDAHRRRVPEGAERSRPGRGDDRA